jgi:hypothetical protein
VVGETADLNEFLFGSERVVRPVLLDIQRGQCFYCKRDIAPRRGACIPLRDLGPVPCRPRPQFRAGRRPLQQHKRERLPACEHLPAWPERNGKYGSQIADELERRGMVAELAASSMFSRGTMEAPFIQSRSRSNRLQGSQADLAQPHLDRLFARAYAVTLEPCSYFRHGHIMSRAGQFHDLP